MNVPFSPPDISESDIQSVVDVLRSGWITTGPVSSQFESELSEFVGTSRTLVQSSCTAALELALRYSGVGPGDEVIVPAYTYTASAAAAIHCGAQIRLVDNAVESFFPTIDRILSEVTSRTKAIITVDFAGIPFPSDILIAALDEQQVSNPHRASRPTVITDAAHSLGGSLGGVPVGCLGDFTAFSFHAVKNLTTAEGGAITWPSLSGCDDDQRYAALRIASLHGQTKDALTKSMAGSWEYDIVEAGYKSNMPDILAALGLSQLRRYPASLERRSKVIARYQDLLGHTIRILAHNTDGVRSSCHLAVTQIPGATEELRDNLITSMSRNGISCNVHFKPLPLFSAYRRLGFDIADFPNAFTAYKQEISLPIYNSISDKEIDEVAYALLKALEETRA